ncbi:unnamed protein product [Mycena citricolor]|uniref:Uncharacterized protein n=1 Tax=Mycena citricolor TaxID=2018698 RepID=A0AAD2HCJ7_9AGAR|nr:unnamed protein product [Mycena citricolor]
MDSKEETRGDLIPQNPSEARPHPGEIMLHPSLIPVSRCEAWIFVEHRTILCQVFRSNRPRIYPHSG